MLGKAFFALTLFFAAATIASAQQPNIIVILCDDLGYGDLASYGHPHIQTPNLDQMAAEGARFTDFYSAAPVCSPSRVGLLTGRSPNRAGVYDWIPEGNAPKPDAREQVHMRYQEVTIPQLLKRSGYATAMSGKWHCNSLFNSTLQPQPGEAGFDHWFATQNNAAPSHANPVNFVRNGQEAGPLQGYSCQIVASEAIQWMERQRRANARQPFFLYIAFHEPHEPIASPPHLVDRYRDVAKNEKEATYFANVENMDHAVGDVLAALKRLDIDHNTLVVFTADNGPETLSRYKGASYSYGVATPLRGMKLWTTEAGFRVAGIMRWPNGIQPGQVVSHPVSSLDFLPSFCYIAGSRPPSTLDLDGADFRPALENKPIFRPKPLLWAYYNALNEHRVAMRDGNWKVLARLEYKKATLEKLQNLHTGNLNDVRKAKLVDFELYDIVNDPSETRNLAESQPRMMATLQRKMTQGYRELLKDSYVWKSQAP